MVHSLVLAMSNDKYADSQKQAGVALQVSLSVYENINQKKVNQWIKYFLKLF